MATIEFQHVWKQFPRQAAPAVRDLSLRAEDGELLVVLGPSGCGKTTALRMLAGLEEPDAGDIRIEDRSVVGMEPKDRDIALVFQQYALYPHLSVRDNLRYPLKVQKAVPKAEQERRIAHAAETLGITRLLDRKPSQLSGGEQQRVALGRAIVRQPRAFLMDEPLSNLDAKLRTHMRTEIKTLQRDLDITTFFVTHDQAEAMTLADRIAVMSAGELRQIGTPDEIYDYPADRFVAEFIGSPPMNLIPGEVRNGQVYALDGWQLATHRPVTTVGGSVDIGMRPEAIVLSESATEVGQPATVFLVEPLGSETIIYVTIGETTLRVRVAPHVRPVIGSTVWLQAVAAGVRLFDRETGKAITW
jgi:ABC-type sugar transport system ATPase subunit